MSNEPTYEELVEAFGKPTPKSEPTYQELVEAFGEQTPKAKRSGIAGDVAAALRGARESIPFGQDIGAAGTYLFGNPLTGEKAPESFEEAKRQQVKRDEALYAEHPLSYGAGFAGGMGAQMMAEGPLALAQAAERKIAEKAAPYVGKTAGRLAGVAGTGAATGAIYGAGEGVTPEERLESMKYGAGAGAVLGLGAEGLTKGLQKVGLIGKGTTPAPLQTTSEALKDEAQKAYAATNTAGLTIKKDAVKDFRENLLKKLETLDYKEHRAPELKSALKELSDSAYTPMGTTSTPYKPVTLHNFDLINRYSNDTLRSPDEHTRMLGKTIREELHNFLNNLTPADITAGDKKTAMESLKTARDFWSRKKKIDDLSEIFNEVEHQSQKTRNTRSIGDLLKDKINTVVRDAKSRKGPTRWTDDEIKTMEELVKSGPLMSKLAAYDPTKSKSSLITSLITAYHSPALGGAGSAAAITASRLNDIFTHERFQYLQDLIAAGGKHHLVRNTPKPSVEPLSSKIRQTVVPFSSTRFEAEGTPMGQLDREERASGGKVNKRDYPAKRLNKLERAALKAQRDIALETKPIMAQPDALVAKALEIAKGV